jgi:hypothetical protein
MITRDTSLAEEISVAESPFYPNFQLAKFRKKLLSLSQGERGR